MTQRAFREDTEGTQRILNDNQREREPSDFVIYSEPKICLVSAIKTRLKVKLGSSSDLHDYDEDDHQR